MTQSYTKIIIPTRPQADTIAAIFILKNFGENKFPGIKNAKIEVWQVMPAGETEASLNDKGVVILDLGHSRFDHHGRQTQTTATKLVAEYLGISADPALAKIFEFTERDDFYGKGTLSADPLDRAFGLPGLLACLNRLHGKDPERVVEITLPFFEAHYADEKKRAHELPAEFKAKVSSGKVQTFIAKQRDKKLKVVLIETDNLAMPGYLRSRNGGAYDVVVQLMPSGHVNILTRPTKRVDLRAAAMCLRMEELKFEGKNSDLDANELMKPGRIPQVLNWYFDPATNSIQNGGANPKEITPTKIPKSEFTRIVKIGLES